MRACVGRNLLCAIDWRPRDGVIGIIGQRDRNRIWRSSLIEENAACVCCLPAKADREVRTTCCTLYNRTRRLSRVKHDSLLDDDDIRYLTIVFRRIVVIRDYTALVERTIFIPRKDCVSSPSTSRTRL